MEQKEFMSILLAQTSLEANVSINLTMVGTDGRPQQKPLLRILREWVDFRFVTTERRTRHRLGEVERRIHILEGRMTVFLRVEEVIRCIRESDEPKPALIAEFGLTEIQAEDILEIRLRQLARLEGIRIEKELGELRVELGQLITLLDDRKEMTKLILREIADDTKKFGDDRRTLIEEVASTVPSEVSVPDEPVTVIVSKNGWIRARQGHGIDTASFTYKTGDYAFFVAEARTIWPLIVIDTHGRIYSLRVADLPGGRGDGVPLSTLIDFQEGGKLAQVLTASTDANYLVASSGGCGFIASVGDMVCRNKAGKAFLSLEKGERPLPPAPAVAKGDPINKTSSTNTSVAVLSAAGRLLIFPLTELKVMAKGKGLTLLDLTKGDELMGVAVTTERPLTIQGISRGGKVVSHTLSVKDQTEFRGNRARRGHQIPFRTKVISLLSE
jgi:topoisomerase-4 subunit A